MNDFFSSVWNAVTSLGFEMLAIITLSAFGAVVLISFAACFISSKIRAASKKPFLHLLNCFTALALAVLSTYLSVGQSMAFTAVFWLTGYLIYGLLCAIGRPAAAKKAAVASVTAIPAATPKPEYFTDVPAAKNSVRLEHALSIADKLLLKNLARSDRQELEKMKTALTVMKIKGELSAQEGEILNENFNALLKLMAKYNL